MDWIGAAALLIGTLLLTRKSKSGWLFQVAGDVFMILHFSLVFWNPAIVILNLVFGVMALRGYFKWNGTQVA